MSARVPVLAALGAVALVASIRAHGAEPKARYTDEELAVLEREGPKPVASSQQRFVPASVPPPAAEPSPAPSKAEWTSAPLATDVRITDQSCTARRIREWYRIECPDTYVSRVTGATEGVSVGATQTPYVAWLVFPARAGDRRVFVMIAQTRWGLEADAAVSEQWLPGDAAPLVTVTGLL